MREQTIYNNVGCGGRTSGVLAGYDSDHLGILSASTTNELIEKKRSKKKSKNKREHMRFFQIWKKRRAFTFLVDL